MSGFASLSDVAETLQIPVNDDDFDTLNGFLVSLMEKFQMMVKLPDCRRTDMNFPFGK